MKKIRLLLVCQIRFLFCLSKAAGIVFNMSCIYTCLEIPAKKAQNSFSCNFSFVKKGCNSSASLAFFCSWCIGTYYFWKCQKKNRRFLGHFPPVLPDSSSSVGENAAGFGSRFCLRSRSSSSRSPAKKRLWRRRRSRRFSCRISRICLGLGPKPGSDPNEDCPDLRRFPVRVEMSSAPPADVSNKEKDKMAAR